MSIRLRNIEIFSEAVAHTRFFLFVKTVKNHYLGAWEEIVSCIFPIGRGCGQQSLVIDMAYTPQHIANYFLDKASQEGTRLSPLKLVKLVYIAYGWYLALKNQKLFNEQIEAWQHGPVIPSIYHEFKHFGSSPIVGQSVTVDYSDEDGKIGLKITTPRVPDNDNEANIVLGTVWKSYKDYSAWQLREMTHEAGTPWKQVYVDGVRGIKMQDDHIREHYVDRIGQYIEASSPKRKTTA